MSIGFTVKDTFIKENHHATYIYEIRELYWNL